MSDWLADAARERPDHPAVVADGRSLAYAELEQAVRAAAGGLAAAGVRESRRVGVAARPTTDFAILLHALPRLGAVIAPLDPRVVEEGGPRLERLVAAGGLAAEVLDGLPEECSRGEGRAGESGRGLPPSAEAASPGRSAQPDPHAVHTLVFTSGTSGEPQPVTLSWANHGASASASAAVLGVHPEDRWLCVLPLFHVGGLAILLRSAIYRTTAVLHDGFDPARVKEALESGEVTLVSLVPTMLSRLREEGLAEAPGVRAILLGGGPIPGELLAWAAERGLPVRPTYGMTEAASQIATGRPGEPGARPLPGVELRIGEHEEVLVRGPMVSGASLEGDGWLHTGDRGRLDAEGRLHVTGRLKELIVTGGENVSPLAVEEALREHPAVRDAGVVGVPDPEWGEAVSAYVVLERVAGEEELVDWCRGRLAPHEVPKRVEQVPGLPRNAAGKLLRDELAAAAGRGG